MTTGKSERTGQQAQRDAGATPPTTRMPSPVYRAALATATVEDAEQRIVRLSFSSETPYTRSDFFGEPWVETLGHDEGEVDLSRLNNRAPVLYNHRRTRADRIGSVLEAWVENGRGYARVQLSRRDDIADIWTDVKDGHLPNVSVGYMINERTLTQQNSEGPDEYRVTQWEPLELSLVDIPADPTVGVGRAHQVTDAGDLPAPNTGETTMSDAEREAILAEGRALELTRQNEIRSQFEHVDVDADPDLRQLRERLLADPKANAADAGRRILEHLGRNKSPSGPTAIMPGSMPRITAGTDRGFVKDATDAMLLRCSVIKKDEASIHAQDLRHTSLLELGRTSISQTGGSSSGLSPAQIFAKALSTADFDHILANIGEKAVLAGFNNPEMNTHHLFTRASSNRNFKPAGRVALSEMPGLDQISEGGEYKRGKVVDAGRTVELATWGKVLPITRQAMINDDIEAFATLGLEFGKSAIRLEKDLVFAILTTNPTMQDNVTLFHADHGNLGTAAAPSVTSLGEARKLMRLQKGLADESFLDLQPSVLIVPAALETVAEQLISSIFDPSTGNSAETVNPFGRRLTVVAEPRLDALSATAWYLSCAPAQFASIERVYLSGNTAPYIEERSDFDTDTFELKLRHDFASQAFHWAGLVKNAGS